MKHKNVSTFREHFRIPYAGVVELTEKNFFLLFQVQPTFELKTVEINSSNGVGFLSMETVEEICLHPISH